MTSEQAVEHLEKLKPGMDFADVEELIHTGLFGGSEGLFWWLGATVGVGDLFVCVHVYAFAQIRRSLT